VDPSSLVSAYGALAPFAGALLIAVAYLAKQVRNKDLEIQRLNDRNAELVKEIAPLLANTATALGDATAELRRARP
jgi:uncharacterized membrane-anchored protein